MINENKNPKRTLHFWIFPLVPFIIAVIWTVMFAVWYTVGLSRTIMTPVVLGTAGWFIVWLIRASKRD